MCFDVFVKGHPVTIAAQLFFYSDERFQRYFFYKNVTTISQAYRLALFCDGSKIVNEYDQEIPQSQTADNPVRKSRSTTRDTRKTN